MNSTRKRFALLGALLGALYLIANNTLPGIPDFLMGAVLGIAMASLVISLLPEEVVVKMRNWKRKWLRRGE